MDRHLLEELARLNYEIGFQNGLGNIASEKQIVARDEVFAQLMTQPQPAVIRVELNPNTLTEIANILEKKHEAK